MPDLKPGRIVHVATRYGCQAAMIRGVGGWVVQSFTDRPSIAADGSRVREVIQHYHADAVVVTVIGLPGVHTEPLEHHEGHPADTVIGRDYIASADGGTSYPVGTWHWSEE